MNNLTLKKQKVVMPQNRFISPVLWASILSLIYLIVKNWFGLEIPAWADISSTIIAILCIVFGISNNPTNKEGW